MHAESRFCPRSGPRLYDVENGQVALAYSASPSRSGARPLRVVLTARIASDGTIHASDGAGTIDGTLRDGTLEVTITSAECEHHWSMRKVP